jgi:Suppressor of fused protein (SUFU)
MPAPPVLRDVFNAHRAAWGEEATGYVFENGPGPVRRLDVLVYRPTADVDLTSFVTVGMAVEPMPAAPGPGGGGRAELQLSRQGRLDEAGEHAVAAQLANLAVYPWATGQQMNWGHVVGLGREFSAFPGCRAAFLSGPLSSTGRDYIDTTSGPVRIINVVPITDAERARARTLPPIEFVQSLMAQVNIFAGR